jgi:arylsulfatase A-like enzyme
MCAGSKTPTPVPHLDALARQSVEMEYFYVCPVCSLTRARLMTGQYNYRASVLDTYPVDQPEATVRMISFTCE